MGANWCVQSFCLLRGFWYSIQRLLTLLLFSSAVILTFPATCCCCISCWKGSVSTNLGEYVWISRCQETGRGCPRLHKWNEFLYTKKCGNSHCANSSIMHDQVRITACVAVLNSPLPLRSLNAPNFFFCPYLKTASLTFLKVNVNIPFYLCNYTSCCWRTWCLPWRWYCTWLITVYDLIFARDSCNKSSGEYVE